MEGSTNLHKISNTYAGHWKIIKVRRVKKRNLTLELLNKHKINSIKRPKARQHGVYSGEDELIQFDDILGSDWYQVNIKIYIKLRSLGFSLYSINHFNPLT